jgi:hypothetical protein
MKLKFALISGWLALAPLPCLAQAVSVPAVPMNVPFTTTAGGTFQALTASPPGLATARALTIENNNTNGDNCWLYVFSGSATKALSQLLLPGGSYQRYFPYVPTGPYQATCASTGDTLYVEVE